MLRKFFSRLFQFLPAPVQFILLIYVRGLIIFSLFRIVFFVTSLSLMEDMILKAKILFNWWGFEKGVLFDSVVSSYLLALPALVLTVAWAAGHSNTAKLYRVSWYYLVVMYSLAFFTCAADIPYFHYNFSRLTAAVFNWMGTPGFVVSMIVQEPSYFIYFFLFIALLWVFVRVTKKRIQPFFQNESNPAAVVRTPLFYAKRISVALLFLFVVFMGIRGRKQAPIRIENAFVCNYAFPNQLGLNPVFTLMVSYFDKIVLINEQEAITNVRAFFGTQHSGYESPVARQMIYEGEPVKKNVVLVLMESMSANKMGRYGNKLNLTPTLDSLARISLSFDRIYSAGKHTYNGIYGTLFSYPAFMREHSMSVLKVPYYSGFPWVMKQYGYSNTYFTTHFEMFDNAGGFLTKNYFDRIFAQKDYPKSKAHSIFGVPDHYMFEFSIPKIREVWQQGKPFFVTMLTTSDHGPYVLPKNIQFTPKPGAIQTQIVEYADWSIRHFLELAKKEAWYNNTVFIFIADHGGVVGTTPYDMPLSYHHVPLIIFSPDTTFIKPQAYDMTGGQIDVFPTVMGLLKLSYVNNTFGIDLLREKRPCIMFSADDKIGCIDPHRFYEWRQHGEESFYDYSTNNPENYLTAEKAKADSMKTYAMSMIQCSKWMVEHNLCGPVKMK